MYLSKLELNPSSKAARNDIASPYELHRTLKRIFPNGEEKNNRLLFRVEQSRSGQASKGVVVLVQTALTVPDWTCLPENYCTRIEGPQTVNLRDPNGKSIFMQTQQFAFRLVANPIKRIKTGQISNPQPGKSDGHVRYRREAILDEESQQEWLIQQGEIRGFRPLFIHSATFGLPRQKPLNVTHENKRTIPHVGVRFDGLLEVTDPEKLVMAIENGVGAAKAFGFGLLSLAKPL